MKSTNHETEVGRDVESSCFSARILDGILIV
ncbi:hypothetical protein JOC94_002222 [Bacillus thermophilus]|uniref:Uncharacterized protein n=1 Tax=Siminovitchia thermophila TaxID=1245522 RepID=A0ABS2R785_9BACI|nr:hypothetical protein [Siminovitchia thermophila]